MIKTMKIDKNPSNEKNDEKFIKNDENNKNYKNLSENLFLSKINELKIEINKIDDNLNKIEKNLANELKNTEILRKIEKLDKFKELEKNQQILKEKLAFIEKSHELIKNDVSQLKEQFLSLNESINTNFKVLFRKIEKIKKLEENVEKIEKSIENSKNETINILFKKDNEIIEKINKNNVLVNMLIENSKNHFEEIKKLFSRIEINFLKIISINIEQNNLIKKLLDFKNEIFSKLDYQYNFLKKIFDENKNLKQHFEKQDEKINSLLYKIDFFSNQTFIRINELKTIFLNELNLIKNKIDVKTIEIKNYIYNNKFNKLKNFNFFNFFKGKRK